MSSTKFFKIPVTGTYTKGTHPSSLVPHGSTYVIPEWSDEWSEARGYGPHINYKGVRFIWSFEGGFWFTEMKSDGIVLTYSGGGVFKDAKGIVYPYPYQYDNIILSDEDIVTINASEITDPELIRSLKEEITYKERLKELRNFSLQREEVYQAEIKPREDMIKNPEKYTIKPEERDGMVDPKNRMR